MRDCWVVNRRRPLSRWDDRHAWGFGVFDRSSQRYVGPWCSRLEDAQAIRSALK